MDKSIIPSTLVPVRQGSRVPQDSYPDPSIPATLVVRSDGSLSISSDVINTQSNPTQLVMMPNADGQTNLYMIPKNASSTQTAFLVKPIGGLGWHVDQSSITPVSVSSITPASTSSLTCASTSSITPASISLGSTSSITLASNLSITPASTSSITPASISSITTTGHTLPVQAATSVRTQLASLVKTKLAVTTTITSTSNVASIQNQLSRQGGGTNPAQGNLPVQSFLGPTVPPMQRPPSVLVRPPIFITPSVAAKTVWLRQPLGIAQASPMQSPVVISTSSTSSLPFASLMSQASVCSVTTTAASALQSIASGLRVIQASGGQTPVYVHNITPPVLNHSTTVLTNSQVTSPSSIVNTSTVNSGVTTDENSQLNMTPKIFIINGKSYVLSGRTTVDGIATLIPLVASSSGDGPVSNAVINTQQMSPQSAQSKSTSNQNKYFEKKVIVTLSDSTKFVAVSRSSAVTKITSSNLSKMTTASASNNILRKGQIPQHPILRSAFADVNSAKPTFIKSNPPVQQLLKTRNAVLKRSAAPNKSSVLPLQIPRQGTPESPQSISSEEENNPLLENLPSPIPDDTVRPMLLFRHDVARNLKPAALREWYATNTSKISSTSQPPIAFSISSTSSTNNSKVPPLERNTKLPSGVKAGDPNSQNMSLRTTNGGSMTVSPAAFLSLCQRKPDIVSVNSVVKGTPINKSSDVVTMSVGSASQTLKHLSSLSVDKTNTKQATSPQVIKMRVQNSVSNNLSVSQEPLIATSKSLNGSKESLMKPKNGYEKGTNPNEPVLEYVSNCKAITGKSTPSKLVGIPTNSDGIDVPAGLGGGSSSNKDSCILKISSVFSLKPTDEDTINKESEKEKQNLLPKPSVKCFVPDIKIIDSPVKRTRQTTKKTKTAMLSLLHKMKNSDERNKQETNSKLRPVDKFCRVVLRKLNMRKFKWPISCKTVQTALSRSKCSKRCRQLVLSTFNEREDEIIRMGLRNRHKERLIPCVIFPKERSQNWHEKSRKERVVVRGHSLLTASFNGSMVKPSKVSSAKENSPICISDTSPVTMPQLSTAKSSIGGGLHTAQQGSNALAQNATKSTDISHQSATMLSRPVSSVSVKSLGSADNSNYQIYQIGYKRVLVPTASFENALKALVKKTSTSNTSTASTKEDDARSLLNATVRKGSMPASTSALLDNAVSTLLSLPPNTTPVAAPNNQNVKIKSEPVTLGYGELMDTAPSVKVKSEPLHRGYSDEGNTQDSDALGFDNSRKRRLEVGNSDHQSDEASLATEHQNMDRDTPRAFTISDTPHTEKIRRLKEKLKQKQDALEEIRIKRLSSLSTSKEDTH